MTMLPEDFKDAIEIKPAFPEAYFNLANVLTKQENYIEACEAMNKHQNWLRTHQCPSMYFNEK